MAKKASSIIYKKIDRDLPKKVFKYCETQNKKTILIVTRDNVWAGGGQESRELTIRNFEDTISALTELNYNVVRLNLYGEIADFCYEGFIDMANGQFNQLDQLAIIGRADFVIGADTGLTGFAQIAGSIPTLAVGHPDLYPHSPWGELVMMSKPLEIIDKKTFGLHSVDELKNNLFTLEKTWSNNNLAYLGLAIRPINAIKLKEEAINFLRRYENKKLEDYRTSNDLELESTMKCNVILSDFTYSNLKGILEQATNA